jgi:hypothetical protein
MMLIRRFLVVVVGKKWRKQFHFESRGVRVLTKCSRRQIEIVAAQTILKVDKRPGKHINL